MSPTDTPAPVLVDALGSEPRRPAAFRELLRRGPAAVPAVREGLRHTRPLVREQCCKLLDELLVPDVVDELTARLDDPDARVRSAAVHALSCDRCKSDAAACFPDRLALLPRAIRLLERDPDSQVRAMAVELVGLWVHSRPGALAALARAHDEDPSPSVRKKAGWYTPGGPVHRRTAPRPARAVRR
ncbi:HEAT repeat domain-containing protein [Streptomyces sp. MBT65]|uniref:HEAT repeat domain-containing protein n=1 Tax=Streptomyces sp. MBT65 TaxID=1488395 RepID=UPI00190C556A|nr:HEAT repeat domain-containing protein [Streptomyces sp. MBT65]MBK3572369.1 HEAT repeat domain-containing protein [Streptomyces sp. MBT65]